MNLKISTNNWDKSYRKGKYINDHPINFVNDIVFCVNNYFTKNAKGFYPGCGNGRNLIPLLNSGLNIDANDISEVATEQLIRSFPTANIKVENFLEYDGEKYDYLISIQLFQHGKNYKKYFNKTIQCLKPKGIFFLRVNSTNTQIIEKHKIIKKNKYGSQTIQYLSGSKPGEYIHFYSAEEIISLTKKDFEIIMPLREDRIERIDGTYWNQWETILKLR